MINFLAVVSMLAEILSNRQQSFGFVHCTIRYQYSSRFIFRNESRENHTMFTYPITERSCSFNSR